jgi:hypothetical protein
LKAENLAGAEIELSGWTQGDHHNTRGVVGAISSSTSADCGPR